jgi:hypothetical protein
MTVAPTLEVRPGYPFNVMGTQDVIFAGPYQEAEPPMNLERLRTHPPVALKGRVPGDLHEALAAYADYYRSVHDRPVVARGPRLAHLPRRRPGLPSMAPAGG